jgi:hypothetical protein
MAKHNYTDEQIQFIMDSRVQGYTFAEIAEQFTEEFGVKRSTDQINGTFKTHKSKYDLPEIQKHPEKKKKETKAKIINGYLEFVDKNKYLPTFSDLNDQGLPERTIRDHFKNIDGLDTAAREASPSVFKQIVDEYSFTEEQFEKLKKDIKKHKRFVITTAVTGCDIHQPSLQAIKNYCKRNKAKLLILPCSDPAKRNGRSRWQLDHRIDRKAVVFKDVELNSKFFISTIKLSAKHINPLTGLSRIGQSNGSFCYASPKQSLEYVANSATKKIPRALMTTGAITKSQYNTQMYMSERTAYIADFDHKLGAVVVEIEDDKLFYFRTIEMNEEDGSFYDIDRKYTSDGKIYKYNGKDHTADLVQFGDYHVGDTDPEAKAVGKAICDLTKPKYLTVEDFFNGHSISHHDQGKLLTEAKKVELGYHDLDIELKANGDELKEIMGWKNHGQLVVKYGNHEDFLYRYLNNGNFTKDKTNFKRAVNVADAMLNRDWKNPFEYCMRELQNIGDTENIKFLQDEDHSFVINGVENGVHGHLGPNGSRGGSLPAMEKAYGSVNIGHSHTAGIWRNVFRVGTTSYLKVSYNKGPSSWTQTHLIQHANGARQLINCINGKFKLD